MDVGFKNLGRDLGPRNLFWYRVLGSLTSCGCYHGRCGRGDGGGHGSRRRVRGPLLVDAVPVGCHQY